MIEVPHVLTNLAWIILIILPFTFTIGIRKEV